MNNDFRYLEIPLAEIQRDLNLQIGSFDVIKTTVRSVLSSASLIVSLVGALQLVTARIAPAWLCLYQTGVILTAVLYVALIVLCIAALWPVSVWSPLKPEWDNLVTTFIDLNEEEIISKHLSSVLSAIEKNKPLLKSYVRLQMAALILLPIIVVILLSLALIPRI
jgi:hypothetical protein